jgi:hypothetical protein
MKTITAILLVFSLLFSIACTSETPHGQCIGAFDDGDPKLIYKADAWNIVLGVIFIETIIVPVLVVATQIKCPVAERKSKESLNGDRR